MHCGDGSSLTNAKNKIKDIVASTYMMISGNVHIYAWLKRGLCFSWSRLSVSALFPPLKASLCWYTHKQKNFLMQFFVFLSAYTCLWFFRFCKTTDFATISHFNLHTFMTLCWKFHAFNQKCTIVHFLTANKMDYWWNENQKSSSLKALRYSCYKKCSLA